jgi:amino acid transporter
VGVSSPFEKWTFSVGSFQSAAILVFFGFVGWESMSLCIRDLRDPTKDTVFVYWVSFGTVTLVYLSLASTVSGFALMGHKIGGTDGILQLLLQSPLLVPLRICIIAVLIANLNAWVLAGYRQFQLFEGAIRPAHSLTKTKRARHRGLLLAYFLLVSLLPLTVNSIY